VEVVPNVAEVVAVVLVVVIVAAFRKRQDESALASAEVLVKSGLGGVRMRFLEVPTVVIPEGVQNSNSIISFHENPSKLV
jgi:hypothetical protein